MIASQNVCELRRELPRQCNLRHRQSNRSTGTIPRSFSGDAMDDEFCRERARTVRALAEQADPFIKLRLLQLAAHYERRLDRSQKAGRDRSGMQAPRLPDTLSTASRDAVDLRRGI